MEIHKTNTVFGIGRDLPLNYVTRPSADDFLIDNLTRDKHLVIYGSSKQGKTSLRKHCLLDEDSVVIHCSNKWNLSDIHAAILKSFGYEVTQSNSKTSGGKFKLIATIKAGLFGTEASGGSEAEYEKKSETVTQPLELDPEDVNDIIRAIKDTGKFIVLEDFHYLTPETQRDFSVALKAYHEASDLCFIIVGVWLEENRLTVYNGDLTGRVVSIDADKWQTSELREVIEVGEKLLNIEFAEHFKKVLLTECFHSVHIVQEACYQCCRIEAITQTQEHLKVVGDKVDAKEIIKNVVNEQTGRYNSFITQYSAGFQGTQLEMHRWLLFPILKATKEDLEKGLRWGTIKKVLQDHHPEKEKLNPGNITQALQSCAALQIKKEIKPTILDYDSTNNSLNVVDRGFVIWLENQDRNALLDLAGF